MNAMKTLRNERGVALITSLLLTMIALAIILALLYYLEQGIKLSAAHKRYQNALDASYGASEVFTKQIIPSLLTGATLPAGLSVNDATCLSWKLSNPPSQWGAHCSADQMSPELSKAADAKIKLQGLGSDTGFSVYAKVVDTIPGNSDTSGLDMLDAASGVAYGSSGVSPKHLPATYHVELQGQRDNSPQERSKLSVLYAF
jgi:hypothetical protein